MKHLERQRIFQHVGRLPGELNRRELNVRARSQYQCSINRRSLVRFSWLNFQDALLTRSQRAIDVRNLRPNPHLTGHGFPFRD